MYSEIGIQFLATDLPNVEVGYLQYEPLSPLSPDYAHQFTRNFSVPPKLLVFTSQLNHESSPTQTLDLEITVPLLNTTHFNLTVRSNFRAWRGYYLACTDESPYLCEAETLQAQTSGRKLALDLPTKLKSNLSFLSFNSLKVFYGLQGFQTKTGLKVNLYDYLYENSVLHFLLEFLREGERAEVSYLMIRKIRCPSSHYLSEFPSFLCKPCA